MSNKLHLDADDWEILINILSQYNIPFYAYGSRAKGTSSKFSDIDLLVKHKIDFAQIKEDFEESDLSVKVDIKSTDELSEKFFKSIEHDLILIWAPS